MLVFIFWTALVLIGVLSLVLLCSLLTLFIKTYRKYLTKAVMLSVGLFAALLVTDLLIYWDMVVTMNRPPEDGIFIDIIPFDSILTHSLNWHIPGMVVLIAGTLILTRRIKKSVFFWIGLGVAMVLICGFLVLAYDVLSNWLPREYLHLSVWWL